MSSRFPLLSLTNWSQQWCLKTSDKKTWEWKQIYEGFQLPGRPESLTAAPFRGCNDCAPIVVWGGPFSLCGPLGRAFALHAIRPQNHTYGFNQELDSSYTANVFSLVYGVYFNFIDKLNFFIHPFLFPSFK